MYFVIIKLSGLFFAFIVIFPYCPQSNSLPSSVHFYPCRVCSCTVTSSRLPPASCLVSFTPGVSPCLVCLVSPRRLVWPCSPLASRLVSLAPGVSSCLVLSRPRRSVSSSFARFARPPRPISSCSLPASCLVSLATSVLSRLARPRRLVSLAPSLVSLAPSISSRLVWSRSPPASCLVSLAPGVLSCLAHPRRLAPDSMLYWSATWDNVFPDVPYFPKKDDDFHIPPVDVKRIWP